MLTPVATKTKSLEDYRPLIGNEQTDEIYALAEPLKGARVLHVNATSFGGGVAEILPSLVPLMEDVGLLAKWHVIQGADELFQVTKALHNSLQGMHIPFGQEMWQVWSRYNQLNAQLLEGDYDFVVVHDPQPAGILHFLREGGSLGRDARWVWRCHIDLTSAQPETWSHLRPYLETYDAAIFTMKAFAKKDLVGPKVWVFPPAIDPLSPKNELRSSEAVDGVLSRFGVDPARPLILQAARLDAWKDPLGVLEAYFQVKRHAPEVQLVYLAAIADDDPEGWDYYDMTVARAGGDPDVHIFPNVALGIGDLEVNAFQTGAQVVLQKSLREGFGLSVSEALWKARPVVAGRVGGIPLQVVHGKTGYMVSTPSECAQRTLYLLRHPQRAEQMGRQGREHVRRNFLITRYLKDYLRLFQSLERDRKRLPAMSYPRGRNGSSPGF